MFSSNRNPFTLITIGQYDLATQLPKLFLWMVNIVLTDHKHHFYSFSEGKIDFPTIFQILMSKG